MTKNRIFASLLGGSTYAAELSKDSVAHCLGHERHKRACP
jgi:hypothetical protein